MKKLFAFVLGLFLFLCPFAVQAEEIVDAPAPEPMSEDALNYLLSEDMYQDTLSWQGNKNILEKEGTYSMFYLSRQNRRRNKSISK